MTREGRRINSTLKLFLIFGLALLCVPGRVAEAARQQVSQDRDLKELDLKQWDCLNRPEGTGKTPDGVARNRLKNRSAPEGASLHRGNRYRRFPAAHFPV